MARLRKSPTERVREAFSCRPLFPERRGDNEALLRRMRQPSPRHAPLQVAGLGGGLFQQVGVV